MHTTKNLTPAAPIRRPAISPRVASQLKTLRAAFLQADPSGRRAFLLLARALPTRAHPKSIKREQVHV